MMNKIFWGCLTFGMLTLPIYGENNVSRLYDTVQSIDEVVVSASRDEPLLKNTPEVIRVVSQKDIEALNVHSISGVLEHITGTNIESGTGSGFPDRGIVSINGMAARYNLILIDGVRLLSEHIHTGRNIEHIPVENIQRIELIKGAASAQYGSDALGGVLNIVTKKAGNKTELEAYGKAGSYGSYEGGISVRTPVTKDIKVSTFSSWEESDGFPVIEPNFRSGHLGYARYNMMSRIDFRPGSNVHTYAWVHYNQNKMEWPFSENMKHGWLFTPVIGGKYAIDEDIALNTQIAYNKWYAEQSRERNELLHPELYLTYDGLSGNNIMLGGEYKYQRFRRTSVKLGNQKTIGVFLQDKYTFNEQLAIKASLRYDRVADISGVFSPKVSVLYDPTKLLRVRASFGKGFKAPSVQQLYEEGAGHGGQAYRFGNQDLKPQYSRTFTAGVEMYPHNSVEIIGYGFYNRVEEMIVPVYEPGLYITREGDTVDIWRRKNIHSAHIYGGDITARYYWDDGCYIEGGATITETRNEGPHKKLPYDPGSSYYGKGVVKKEWSSGLEMNMFVSYKSTWGRSVWNWKPGNPEEDPDNSEGLSTDLANYQMLKAGVKLILNKHYHFSVNGYNLLGQQIEKLDDYLTIRKGEPYVRGALKVQF